MALGDINGDSKLDIVTANSGDSSVSVLLGNGNGTFSAKTDSATSTSPRAVAIGDLSGDGKADLVTANYSGNNISVLLETATAPSAPRRITRPGPIVGPEELPVVISPATANSTSSQRIVD